MINANRTRVKDLLTTHTLDQIVEIWGWVKTGRVGKNVAFIQLSDGSCFNTIQLVIDNTVNDVDVKQAVLTGTCIQVSGKLIESQGKGQSR